MLDTWDLNNPYAKTEQRLLQTTKHQWFVYAGGNANFNADDFNLFFNARSGCFLWKNIWDLAATSSIGVNDVSSFSIGLMSRVHYPITVKEKYYISPYVGLGVSYILLGSESICDIPIYTGISWFIGPGSLDLGCQFSNNITPAGYAFNYTITLGYTFLLSKMK